MYSALLDACVLVPNALNDTLLRLAERGFYRPLWSERILEETKRAIIRIHPNISEARIDARLEAMNSAFEDALVTAWEPVCAGLDLPDPDDRHVWAAAIKGGAQTIVTSNLKDFPEPYLSTTAIVATHPDDFLLDQLDLYPGLALEVLEEQVADLINPPTDLAGILNRLERAGVPRFADAVRLLVPKGS
jgi:predicted nucleic acid-binding protein